MTPIDGAKKFTALFAGFGSLAVLPPALYVHVTIMVCTYLTVQGVIDIVKARSK